jgi:hypothetical protein
MKRARPPAPAVAAGHLDGSLVALVAYLGEIQLLRLDTSLPGGAELLQRHRSKDSFVGDTDLHISAGRAVFLTDGWRSRRVVDALSGKAHRLRHRGELTLGLHEQSGMMWLASGSPSRVWLDDVSGAGQLGRPIATDAAASAVALGILDGERVVAVLAGGTIYLHHSESGERLAGPIATTPSARSVAWAHLADREVLVTLHTATVRIWNPHTGRKLSELPFGTSIDTMAVHAGIGQSALVVVGGPGVVFAELREFPRRPLDA